jgi:RNA-binding signal recognition particle 68
VQPEAFVTDARSFLAIPLLSAERAWAMAMEVKGQLAAGPEAPKRMHLQRRLWKAAAWGAELSRLAAARGDARTGAAAAATGARCMHDLIQNLHPLQQANAQATE